MSSPSKILEVSTKNWKSDSRRGCPNSQILWRNFRRGLTEAPGTWLGAVFGVRFMFHVEGAEALLRCAAFAVVERILLHLSNSDALPTRLKSDPPPCPTGI